MHSGHNRWSPEACQQFCIVIADSVAVVLRKTAAAMPSSAFAQRSAHGVAEGVLDRDKSALTTYRLNKEFESSTTVCRGEQLFMISAAKAKSETLFKGE